MLNYIYPFTIPDDMSHMSGWVDVVVYNIPKRKVSRRCWAQLYFYFKKNFYEFASLHPQMREGGQVCVCVVNNCVRSFEMYFYYNIKITYALFVLYEFVF
jgi:hypothetical protein